MAKKKTAKPGIVMKITEFPIPQTIEEAADMLAKLGETQREAEGIAGRTDIEVARIRQSGGELIGPLQASMQGMFNALRAFAEARRQELTNGGKTKLIKLPTGEMKWRTTPPKVEIEDEAALLKAIEGTDHYAQFACNKTFIDKDALKKDAETAATLPGVTITQGEDFRVKPESASGELTDATIQKLLKASG
ncbi:host-nuclease inhibitor Gam family protein [Patescibacteria group bacterium]|nr:host-nuclease inhibitor Gam family protein [Patescibacteria group bacterium]MBU1907787.1 host-nuclease inhibitor Gam family protein [Patescibacteria group bacterium]